MMKKPKRTATAPTSSTNASHSDDLHEPVMKKARKSGPTVSIDAVIPDDLLEFGILSRVPVKHLLRLQFVSKKWHGIISNPHLRFVYMQSKSVPSGIICSLYMQSKFVPSGIICLDRLAPHTYLSRNQCSYSIGIPILVNRSFEIFGFRKEYGSIVASCNGILCVRDDYSQSLEIGNPILKNWNSIPDYPWPEEGYTVFGLAVDVGESSVGIKLVLVTIPCSDGLSVLECKFHVFSWNSGDWHMAKARIMLPESTYVYREGIYVNGCLYWRLEEGGQAMWFNIKEELSGIQSLPPGADNPNYGNFIEYGGNLGYALMKDMELQLWTLDHTCWYKRLSITLMYDPQTRKLKSSSKEMQLIKRKLGKSRIAPHKIFMMASEGGDTLWFLFEGVVYSYHTQTGVIQMQMESGVLQWYHYKATLVSLPVK